MKEETGSKWLVGWRAAKANILPGLVLQSLMVLILLGYYFHPGVRVTLERLAVIKAAWGYGFSALAGVCAGALIPELMRVLILQKGKATRRNATQLLFTIPFWGVMSLLVDYFYRLQAIWFGDEAIPSVVIPQVLVDQFIYSPFIAAPLTVWGYHWRNAGYRWPERWWTFAYYRDRVAPTILANWVVWIPVVSVLYALPQTVQIPLFALALALWVMIFTWMSEERP